MNTKEVVVLIWKREAHGDFYAYAPQYGWNVGEDREDRRNPELTEEQRRNKLRDKILSRVNDYSDPERITDVFVQVCQLMPAKP